MPPSSQWTTALASPATNRSAALTARSRTGSISVLAALAYGQIDELADSRVAHDDRLGGANSTRGNDSAVEDEVWISRQEDLVLRAGWFAFGAVPNDDGPALLACHSGQLEGRGEARTASAAKTGTIHELDQLEAG